MKPPINPLQRRARAPRRGRFDRNLVFGTWLLVGASALPFGCAGRSDAEGQNGAVDGNIVSGDAVARGGDAGATSHGGSAGRPLDTSGGAGSMIPAGSGGRSPSIDGTTIRFTDGSTIHSDGTSFEGRPYSVDGGGPRCCSDGTALNVAGRDGGFIFTDGTGIVTDGTGITQGGDGENEQADGTSEGTPDSEWSDGGPEDGNPG